ncbi:hypothetical protein AAG570_006054 [Ranatra chinensis]|uniref:SEFIR domain-containing protein n=1 Tax=Ranatra chinensis TaxID=642074 RepID=A0ABD0XWW7_9HEMI
MVIPTRSCSRAWQRSAVFLVFLLHVGCDSKYQGRCPDSALADNLRHSRPQSELCNNYTTDCSHQVAFIKLDMPAVAYSNATCLMMYLSNDSFDCSHENFRGTPSQKEEYGRMRLSSYLYKDGCHEIPNFNLTFTDIKWKRLRMRYVENSVAEQRKIALCREFKVDPFRNALPASLTLFFDCLWSTGGYDKKAYHFQYQVITPSDYTFFYDYAFFVPDHNYIDEEKTNLINWELFMVVDITDIPHYISVRVQTAPEHFNISAYKIELYRTLAETRVIRMWRPNMTSDTGGGGSGGCEVTREEIRCRYDTNFRPGIYHFTASIVHPICQSSREGCYVSKTPYITLVELPEKIGLISIVAVVILVPIFLTAYFISRRKCYSKVETPAPVGPPKMLLMYNPVSTQHVRVMMEITRYLRSCRLHAMLDQFGIPQSEHKDPVQWYREAFDEADFVGIFASPKTSAVERDAILRCTRYLHTETIAQSQLRAKLCLPGARCKFFCIALPGTSWDTLPPEAQALKRYTLPRDLDPLLVLVGLAPQCDHGAGFERALAVALAPETPITIAVPNLPPPSAITSNDEEQQPLANHNLTQHNQQQRTPPESCCPDAFSISDQDLLTSSQPYLSDTGSRTSSLDQFSLLGE